MGAGFGLNAEIQEALRGPEDGGVRRSGAAG
jgi:hypothetical protein